MLSPVPTSAELASRLSAMLAHDMAGALQGLKAALALFDDSADEALQAEARALARQSADELEARLAFCRAAFAGRGVEGPAEFERLCQLRLGHRQALAQGAEVIRGHGTGTRRNPLGQVGTPG